MAYTTTYPVSPNGGIIYGDPTTFLASGTYTIPPTATANSTIMVESIGGGSGGGSNQTSTYWQSATDWVTYNGGGGAGSNSNNSLVGLPGSYILGVYRLGFFTNSPAGGTITVNIGAGGAGAIKGAQTITSPAANSGGGVTQSAATAGGASSCTYLGATFASAAGGIANTGTFVSTAYTALGAFADSSLLSSTMPKPGVDNYSIQWTSATGNVFSGLTNTNGQTGKDDLGATYAPRALVNSGQIAVQLTPGTIGTAGADGGAFQGGQSVAPYAKIGSTGTYTFARGGNGGQPGGGGGFGAGHGTIVPNASVSYTFTSAQWGGNGGAGRVRIWFQA